MRSMVFTGIGAMALLASGAAHAQYEVRDDANLVNSGKEVVQGAQTIQQLAQQLETMKQQLTTAEQTFDTLSHAPTGALASFSSQFNVTALRNILPTNMTSLSTVLNGTGLGAMGSLGQQYADQNRIYQPQANDFVAQQMTTNAGSIAGTQALANQLYFSASQHINVIQSLEQSLTDAPDEKTVGDIQARVATEQTYIAAQQVQAQAIQTWQTAQVRNVDEQNAEKQRQNIDDVLAQDASSSNGS